MSRDFSIYVPRSMKRENYQYILRMMRCNARAMRESKAVQQMHEDMIIHGTGFISSEAQQAIVNRTVQLFKGLPPYNFEPDMGPVIRASDVKINTKLGVIK